MADQLVVDWTRPRLTPLQLIPFMPKFVRALEEGDRQRVAETHAVTPTCLLGLFTSALGRGGGGGPRPWDVMGMGQAPSQPASRRHRYSLASSYICRPT